MEKILEVRDLHVSFPTIRGHLQAVRGVSFDIWKGEVLALVGESGSGKSVTAKALMKLIPMPPGEINKGQVLFCGKDILQTSEKEMQQLRGNEIAMVFQDPMTSLNPTLKIGRQIVEVLQQHLHMKRLEAEEKAIELLDSVGIKQARVRMYQYPHQLSGGMRQRVMIAMAISCNPQILIADEPTTALDVTVQAQILQLLKRLKANFGMSILLITHDLGVVANMADRVAVMYAGKIVEIGTVEEIFYDPRHPYTWALLDSMPSLEQKGELKAIKGHPPDLVNPPKGDAFAPRNPYALKIDFEKEPPLMKITDTHYAATWLLHEKAPKLKQTRWEG